MLFIDQYPDLHVLPKLYLEIKYATLTQFDFKRVRVFSLRPQKKKNPTFTSLGMLTKICV